MVLDELQERSDVMQFSEGAQVFTADGEEVGRITHVVLDPLEKSVSHIVVRKGLIFTEDKVIPIDLFETANPDQVTLREDAGDLERLPPFREAHYVSVETARTTGGDAPIGAGGLYWYPPADMAASDEFSRIEYPHAPERRYVESEKENIPEGTIALQAGARVISADDQLVGIIESVLTQADTGYASHVVIAQGLLLKTRKFVPTAWFRLVEKDTVYLSVDAALLERLPEY